MLCIAFSVVFSGGTTPGSMLTYVSPLVVQCDVPKKECCFVSLERRGLRAAGVGVQMLALLRVCRPGRPLPGPIGGPVSCS